MRRDRLTFAMMVGIPLIQLTLFGFAINTDPQHLPTAVLAADDGPLARRFLAALTNSGYFALSRRLATESEAERLIARGQVQFVVNMPVGFERRLVRGERPPLLIEVDASDPLAAANAVAAVQAMSANVLNRELSGALEHLQGRPPPFELRIHLRYNPERITSYNIVPGLLGVILTMTMVLMTGLAMTREKERGTFENLLATPATPFEVMTGKIVPYIVIGLIQVTLVLIAARWIFGVPMLGSLSLLYGVVLMFICANLTLGITFSSMVRNQLQAMQLTFFFFLPSILLSGFMFPFRGMPGWAQTIGNVLPLTHFLQLVRGILLKGNGLMMLFAHVWPILVFIVVVLTIGIRYFQRTLD